MNFCFVLNSGMNERECDHLRTKSSSYKFYELDSVVDARPNGYRAKIKFSVIGEREAWIILSKEDGTNKKLESALDIGIFHAVSRRMHLDIDSIRVFNMDFSNRL